MNRARSRKHESSAPANTVPDRLAFDPIELKHGVALPAADAEFFKWFYGIKGHHEFPELEHRLARISRQAPDRFDFEWNVLWHAWRAATWRQPTSEEIIALAKRLIESKADDVIMTRFQHGPFIWKDSLDFVTRRPTPATMLAAQIACVCKSLKIRQDWVMLSKLVAVAGLGADIDPLSLRVSARKLMQGVEKKDLLLVVWPQDAGRTLSSVESFLDRQMSRHS